MKKPSERIEELIREVADHRIRTAIRQPGEDLLMKMTGISEADIAERLLTDHRTILSAIVAYLDEQAEALSHDRE